jgi:hypothetical protein
MGRQLLGRKFVVVTDHKGLEYFITQPNLSGRQTCWWEYISHFNFEILHVDGVDNKVADWLSRYFEYDEPDETHPKSDYVNVDTKLDPEGELLPLDRYVEIRTTAARQSN